MEKLLNDLIDRLKAALGSDLLSVVLYGSAATTDYHAKYSDLNVLCILNQVTLDELERAAPVVRSWIKNGQPPPVLMSAEEISDAADVFPIEYLDIKESYRILHGADLVASIQIDTSQHREQLEYELRSRLLRLRRRYLESQHDDRAVAQLMIESLPTFATLFRHALLLAGVPCQVKKHEIFRAAAERFQIGPAPFVQLLDVRKGALKAPPSEVRSWFGSYLSGIARMCEIVDKQ